MVEVIISGITGAIATAMKGAIYIITSIFGFNFQTFVDAFPYAGPAYAVFQAFATGIVLLLASVQLIPFIINSSSNRTSPIRIAFGVFIAIAGIYYGNYILEGIMKISELPYQALLHTNAYEFSIDSFDLAGIISVAANDIFPVSSMLLYGVLLVMVGVAFIKLLLEGVERYVILFVLLYLSPLPACTLASPETSGIFKKYLSMFISQCILLILNIWSVQMVYSLFWSVTFSPVKMLTLLIGYAFIRIASRLDSYLNQLGLNAAITGSGLGSELIATGMGIMRKFSPGGGKTFGAEGQPGGSGILGLSKTIGGFVQKTSPISSTGVFGKNIAGALGNTASQGIAAAKDAKHAGKSGIHAFGKAVRENAGKNLHDANLKTQGENIFADWVGGARHGTAALIATGAQARIPDQAKNDISRHAHLAGTAMASVGDGVAYNDKSIVGSIMKGIGAENIDGGKELVGAAMGTIPTENTQTSLTSSGIHTSYEVDGKKHDWDIKTHSQFQSLSSSEQSAYASFKSSDGATYYASHTSDYLPSAVQKQAATVTEAISKFAANPSSSPLTSEHISYISSHKDSFNAMMSQMAENGSSMSYTAETSSMCADMVHMAATMTRGANISQSQIARIENAVRDFSSGDVKDFSFDGEGFKISVNDGGKGHVYNILTEQGMNQYRDEGGNLDWSNLRNQGFTKTNVGGKEMYVLYKETSEFKNAQDARNQNLSAN